MFYFDVNATVPLCESARNAWLEAEAQHWANPSSPYASASRVHVYLDQARERLAALLGCTPELLVFNSGATEGNNALFTYFRRRYPGTGRVAVSAVEHPCVIEAARYEFGERCEVLPVNNDGFVDLEVLDKRLRQGDLILVSIMAANNETGILQPWREAACLCQEHGVFFHCDASQWIGKLPSRHLGVCDFLTGCAHKFGGPKGIGFLKLAADHSGFKALAGGEQEGGRRAGTENYPGIAAMLAALELRESQLSATFLKKAAQGRDGFEDSVSKGLPEVRVVGSGAPRLWNTTSLILAKHANIRWVGMLDKQGFAVSTGSACATGKEGSSHVLAAMGLGPKALRVVRISGGWETKGSEWQALAKAFLNVNEALSAEPYVVVPTA